MPKLSIVIPTYNEEKYLPKLLESIRSQKFKDYEIIIADANSKDKTREVAEKFGARVVEGGRPSRGRNNGAAAAISDLILFFDADVVLPDHEFLGRALGEFEKRKLDVGTGLIKALSEKIIDHFFVELYNIYSFAVQKLLPHMPGFFIMVKKKVHDEIRGFDEDLEFAEDHDYARRASRVGRFGFLRNARLPVSMRRFDKEGRMTIALKYILGEIYILRHGHVPSGSVEYDWGEYDKEVQKESAFKTILKNGKKLIDGKK